MFACCAAFVAWVGGVALGCVGKLPIELSQGIITAEYELRVVALPIRLLMPLVAPAIVCPLLE